MSWALEGGDFGGCWLVLLLVPLIFLPSSFYEEQRANRGKGKGKSNKN